jgi:hypothetical protein
MSDLPVELAFLDRPDPAYDKPNTVVQVHGATYQWVAWHRGGHVTLAIGKRHLRSSADQYTTLCGVNVPTRGRRVAATDGSIWHTGDCANCMREAAKLGAVRGAV